MTAAKKSRPNRKPKPAVVGVPSSELLAGSFTMTIRNINTGDTITLDAHLARELCKRLDAFGDDCSPWCKDLRKRIRRKIRQCTANGKGE